MPKFFQGFDPTKLSFNKVIKLKYIDDVSDEDCIMYVFENGEECNQQFIGTVDEVDPLQKKCIYVEVISPAFKWGLKKNVWKQEKMFATNEQGTFEAPDFSINPETGLPRPEGSIRVDAVPPRLPNNWQVEPIDNYLLSIHPELEYSNADNAAQTLHTPHQHQPQRIASPQPVQQPQAITEPLNQPYAAPQQPVQQPMNTQYVQQPQQHIQQPQQTHSLVQTTNAVIDIDRMAQTIEYIDIKHHGKNIRVTKQEFVECVIKAKDDPKSSFAGEEIIKKENMLIKSMIEMSKKKLCEITLRVQLELPPKEVYDTIANAYEEKYSKEFVRSLTARIPQDSLIESLAEGLSYYYTGSGLEDIEDNVSEPDPETDNFTVEED